LNDLEIFSNKELIMKTNMTIYPNVTDVTDSIYDEYMKDRFPDGDVNGTDFRDCSLERELDSAAAGTGLAFVVFTQAIVELPASPFWSIIFFLMLLALGLGSQIGTMEGVVNTVFDCSYFKGVRKELLTGNL
jgi:solute carrier family 6 amino acid/orphan transporter-like 15/16/17/18/20